MFEIEQKAFNALCEYWGKETALKIFMIATDSDFPTFGIDDSEPDDLTYFMSQYCTACGGDWGQMLLTGIKKLWPEIYNAIPDNMGIYAFAAILNVLALCGVEI